MAAMGLQASGSDFMLLTFELQILKMGVAANPKFFPDAIILLQILVLIYFFIRN